MAFKDSLSFTCGFSTGPYTFEPHMLFLLLRIQVRFFNVQYLKLVLTYSGKRCLFASGLAHPVNLRVGCIQERPQGAVLYERELAS